MRKGVVAKRCACGSFWKKGAQACGRCGSARFSSWGFYVDTHAAGARERRKSIRSGFPSREAAEQELATITKQFGNGSYSPPSDQPLQDYLAAWLKARTHIRPTTRDGYTILIERYLCGTYLGIGGVPLRSLTRPGVKRFYADLERRGRMWGDRPLSPKAVHNVHLLLHKALEDAVEDGLIPANPARRAHRLAVRRPEMKTWTEEQLASFLAWVRGDRL